MTLHERVAGYVRLHPGETVDDIARGVRARTAEVRDVLLGEGFSSSLRGAYVGDRALVYELAHGGRDGSGRAGRPSQCDLIQRVLRDGRWHTAAEIHQRCGFSRLNSRISELRSRRGMAIVCEHVAGAGTGPDAYRYRLVGTSEAGDGAPPTTSASSPASDAQTSRDLQLAIGAA